MLPKTLYVSLPYLYIAIGVICGVALESEIILLFSSLLMLMGFLILWMRHHSHHNFSVAPVVEMRKIKTRNWSDIFQAEQERRMVELARTFPLIDSSGNIIPFDRRVASRKASEAA